MVFLRLSGYRIAASAGTRLGQRRSDPGSTDGLPESARFLAKPAGASGGRLGRSASVVAYPLDAHGGPRHVSNQSSEPLTITFVDPNRCVDGETSVLPIADDHRRKAVGSTRRLSDGVWRPTFVLTRKSREGEIAVTRKQRDAAAGSLRCRSTRSLNTQQHKTRYQTRSS